MQTVTSFAEIPQTTDMRIKALGLRVLEAQINTISRTGRPMHRMAVRQTVEPIRAVDKDVARQVEQDPNYRAALWLARRSKRRRAKRD